MPHQKRRAAAEAKCHSDRLESAAHMRRADAEAKAMAIGNIADVLRLKTVSPLQKCVCRKAGKDCYCSQGVGAGSKTKGSERMAGGAPRKWKSVSAMQKAIDAYFKKCEGEPFIGDDGCAVRDKYGMPIIINAKPPTITGLALALGFTGRQALLDYQARPEFADTVTRAKSRCEEYAESRLYDKDGANGAKFSLGCNFGWREVNETKLTTDAVKVVIDV